MAECLEMTLRSPYFEGVAEGTKTVEMRLFDEKRRSLAVGDTVVFRAVEDLRRAVTARIVSLTVYPDFTALARAHDPVSLGFPGKTPEEIGEGMRVFYSDGEIRTWGVLAIGLQRLTEA